MINKGRSSICTSLHIISFGKEVNSDPSRITLENGGATKKTIKNVFNVYLYSCDRVNDRQTFNNLQ